MPTLFPPLELMDGDDDAIGGGDVLSPELRASFDNLHAAIRAQQQRRNTTEQPFDVSTFHDGLKRKLSSSDDGVVMPSFANEGDDVDERNSNAKVERRKFEAALAAILAADEEITHLSNGIAELEDLLLRQQGDGTLHASSHNNIEFPTLPTIVPDESTLLECEFSCANHHKDVNTPSSDWKETLHVPQRRWHFGHY